VPRGTRKLIIELAMSDPCVKNRKRIKRNVRWFALCRTILFGFIFFLRGKRSNRHDAFLSAVWYFRTPVTTLNRSTVSKLTGPRRAEFGRLA
jgi:hypothetical protein